MKKKVKVKVEVEQEIDIEFPYYYIYYSDSGSIYGKIDEVFTYMININNHYPIYQLEKQYTDLQALQSYMNPKYQSSKEDWDVAITMFNEFYKHYFKS